MTMPRIGPLTALTYKAEIFDADRFKESCSVGAYLGMPLTHTVRLFRDAKARENLEMSIKRTEISIS